jgi:hypothetical protein
MRFNGAWRRAVVALGAITLVSSAASAPQGGTKLSALARLEPGLWQLRDLNNPGAQQSICVADPAALLQLRHRNAPCSRLVIADGERAATVHYTCPAGGFGRTEVRVETPRLVQIDTQGIVDNAPFAYRAEARRIGVCGRGGPAGS